MRHRSQHTSPRAGLSLLCLAALLPLAGCQINANKNHGDDKVDISTPFGGLSVKTNEQAVGAGVGLDVYPGATLIKKDEDNGAADVNMNFGSFHLGVKALSYRTSDSPTKVLDFYRKQMARFGTVLDCEGNHPVTGPDRTPDGLTCSDDNDSHPHVHIETDTEHRQLKAGSKRHQHIVAVGQTDGYTKIGLVALDLPGGFIDGNSSSQ